MLCATAPTSNAVLSSTTTPASAHQQTCAPASSLFRGQQFISNTDGVSQHGMMASRGLSPGYGPVLHCMKPYCMGDEIVKTVRAF